MKNGISEPSLYFVTAKFFFIHICAPIVTSSIGGVGDGVVVLVGVFVGVLVGVFVGVVV